MMSVQLVLVVHLVYLRWVSVCERVFINKVNTTYLSLGLVQ